MTKDDLTHEDLKYLFSTVDIDGGGSVEVGEFVKWISASTTAASTDKQSNALSVDDLSEVSPKHTRMLQRLVKYKTSEELELLECTFTPNVSASLRTLSSGSRSKKRYVSLSGNNKSSSSSSISKDISLTSNNDGDSNVSSDGSNNSVTRRSTNYKPNGHDKYVARLRLAQQQKEDLKMRRENLGKIKRKSPIKRAKDGSIVQSPFRLTTPNRSKQRNLFNLSVKNKKKQQLASTVTNNRVYNKKKSENYSRRSILEKSFSTRGSASTDDGSNVNGYQKEIPLYYIDVKINKNRTCRIAVYQDDDLKDLSMRFSKVHSLGPKKRKTLLNLLLKQRSLCKQMNGADIDSDARTRMESTENQEKKNQVKLDSKQSDLSEDLLDVKINEEVEKDESVVVNSSSWGNMEVDQDATKVSVELKEEEGDDEERDDEEEENEKEEEGGVGERILNRNKRGSFYRGGGGWGDMGNDDEEEEEEEEEDNDEDDNDEEGNDDDEDKDDEDEDDNDEDDNDEDDNDEDDNDEDDNDEDDNDEDDTDEDDNDEDDTDEDDNDEDDNDEDDTAGGWGEF
jgi:hypothetical protein